MSWIQSTLHWGASHISDQLARQDTHKNPLGEVCSWPSRKRFLPWVVGCLLLVAVGRSFAADGNAPWRALVINGELVDVRKFDPTLLVEMRYATTRNCVNTAIYSPDFPCLIRPETAVRLRLVQRMLHDWGYRVKIWDAYRPPEAQAILYRRWAGKGFVADPDVGEGSLHTWGLAVDATLVDLLGREVSMPSGFDVFTPEAGADYRGKDQKAAFHLHLLQSAMGAAGFVGLRNEWWHFYVKDWATHQPLTTMPGGKRSSNVEKSADAANLVIGPPTGSNLSPTDASGPRTAKHPRSALARPLLARPAD